jgi:hypothetical protein
MRFPTQKPTPSEYTVLIVFASGVFVVLGVIALVVALRAPAEKQELVAAAIHWGLWLLGIGVAIAVGFWLFRRFMD